MVIGLLGKSCAGATVAIDARTAAASTQTAHERSVELFDMQALPA